MNKEKTILMLEESKKEKEENIKTISFFKNKLKYIRLFNNFNPLLTSYLFTFLIIILSSNTIIFTNIITSILSIIGIFTFNYIANNLINKKIIGNKDIKNEIETLISYEKSLCNNKLIENNIEFLTKKVDKRNNGMPEFNRNYCSNYEKVSTELKKDEDTIDISTKKIDEDAKTRSILNMLKKYSLKNYIYKNLFNSLLIIICLTFLYLLNIMPITSQIFNIIGCVLLSLNMINDITKYKDTKNTLKDYIDINEYKNIDESISNLTDEIERNIKIIYVYNQYKYDAKIIYDILEKEKLYKNINSCYDRDNVKSEIMDNHTMPKIIIKNQKVV